jgi:hypothetical protein
MYLSTFRDREITKMGTSCCSHHRQWQTPLAMSLDNWIFNSNWKDPMHDSAMSINSNHRFASPSPRQLRYGQVKVPYSYSGSPSPALSEIPFYSFRRIRQVFDLRLSPVPPPLQIDQIRDSMGYIKLNRKLEGGRGRQCVANAPLGPSHLSLFVLKNLHLSSSYVRQSPTTNDLGLTDDDTETLPMICSFLNASSKALARTPNSKSSASNARSGQVQCLPRFSACVWQSTERGVHAARSCQEGIARISVSAPRILGASRWFQAYDDRPDGDVLSLGQHHTVGAGEETRPTRTVEPHRAPHHQLHTPHLIEVLSLFLCGFIRALLDPGPSRRLTAEQALTPSWVTSFAANRTRPLRSA